MSKFFVVPVVVVSLFSLACIGPREPGPLEHEFGQVIFWEVTDSTSSADHCTDAQDFSEAITPPPFGPNTFWMYRMSEDGMSAVAVDCTQLQAETCSDRTEVFTVTGNELIHVGDPELIEAGIGCDIYLDQVWTSRDDGDVGRFEVEFSFSFEGDSTACTAYDTVIAASGANGEGLTNCTVVLDAELAFVRVD